VSEWPGITICDTKPEEFRRCRFLRVCHRVSSSPAFCDPGAHEPAGEECLSNSGNSRQSLRLASAFNGKHPSLMTPDDATRSGANFTVVSDIIEMLEPLSSEDREHVIRTVTTWLRIPHSVAPQVSQPILQKSPAEDEKFAGRAVLPPKDFIFEKDPRTEPERLACLAYYLTHYRDTPYFKTVDLTRLNTEAAQRSLSNPAVASSNAIRDGFFVSAPKAGYKQLSAMAERFVHALPNRTEALQLKQRMASRRSRKSGSNQTATEQAVSEDEIQTQ
jgi:hypothetical protein